MNELIIGYNDFRTPEIKTKIEKLLLEGDIESRSNAILAVVDHRIQDFNAFITELMLSEENEGLRLLYFMAMTLLGDRSAGNDLLEAMNTEDSAENLDAMIKMFGQFSVVHNISRDNISHIEIPQIEEPYHFIKHVDQKPEEVTYVEYEKSEVRDIEEEEVRHENTQDEDQKRLDALQRIKLLLYELTPNIPITLSRMADITGVTQHSLDRYLKELTSKNTTAGRYYPTEQVFVKQINTVNVSIVPTKKREKVVCRDCGEVSHKFPCINCEAGLQCKICKLNIGSNQESATCPHCLNAGHENHFKEWLKIKGTCPNCKERVLWKQLIISLQ